MDTSPADEDQDDLLFLVLARPGSEGPYLVRRRERHGALPGDLCYGGALYVDIAWRATFELNAAMHSRYDLTVACCPCVLGSREGWGCRREFGELAEARSVMRNR